MLTLLKKLPSLALMVSLTLPIALTAATAAPLGGGGSGQGAWRVDNVARGDALNVRIGPGTEYAVITSLRPRARNLDKTICVPTRRLGWRQALPPRVRARMTALPTWCLVERNGTLLGWVNAHYLSRTFR